MMTMGVILALFLITLAFAASWADRRINGPQRVINARERRAEYLARS